MTIASRREPYILLLGDLFFLGLSLWITLVVRYGSSLQENIFYDHIVPFSILFGVWVMIFAMAGLYSRQVVMFRKDLAPLILNTQITNIVIAALFFFLIPYFGITPKTNLIIYLIVSFFLVVLWRVYLFPVLGFRRKRNVLVVGGGKDSQDLAAAIHAVPHYPFSVTGFIDLHEVASEKVAEVVLESIAKDNVSIIVVDIAHPNAVGLLPALFDVSFMKLQITVVDAQRLYESVFGRLPLSMVSHEWLLSNVSISPKVIYDVLKRSLDILTATCALILTVPFYPLVALAIKIEDRGPIFIRQERVGQNNKTIYIVKFRSMNGNDVGESVLKSKLKVTHVGAFLRATRIDELPQFWNVLKGDLSLVGPRPEIPMLVSQYAESIPYYNVRHLIKPGLTGWAQVLHTNHPHHGVNDEATTEKLSYDLYYLKERSLLLDLYIALQTGKIVLSRSGR
ncbi:hypothetical protein COU17_03250 [Candidatus Kaiserbacteria bacterium CG10_big_fil_rev_8_21_14_0_10_49_17]|uniref:Bacterial sugar transferase domain-containing protein n=1 Tax=Candidatus Kaiserbacteria bacterium CG10_big_fil_rev_8_21_14_0_10_49_17 TaxID=1974609 RepID=A0A2M6WDX7_9BACT|nr:MAG: hypothetical protein COU17_03250 [Candidatus Kaiserbacteria bacterium CG10_big_fil_rev_8_21_14_0_10_49_17]